MMHERIGSSARNWKVEALVFSRILSTSSFFTRQPSYSHDYAWIHQGRIIGRCEHHIIEPPTQKSCSVGATIDFLEMSSRIVEKVKSDNQIVDTSCFYI